jgi:LPS sulfotransferase NodH
MQSEPVTSNGVWASKMMWDYFADALGRLRDWPRLGVESDASDADVPAAAVPGLRYVWLRRDDKLAPDDSRCSRGRQVSNDMFPPSCSGT